MKRLVLIVFSISAWLVFASEAHGQNAPNTPRTMITTDQGIAPLIPSMLEPVITGGLLDGILVRNKPVAAVLQSETVETLANGMTITRRVVTKIYRDSSGRTRREQISYPNGATPSVNDSAQVITIYDPVARFGYALDPVRQIASRFKLPAAPTANALLGNQTPLVTKVFRNNAETGTTTAYTLTLPVVASLGSQTIAGVQADGWRMTLKIPAGAFGNTTVVDAVYETWISLDLQLLVKCIATSQLGGTQTLTTTSLVRTEQTGSLFEVPANYTTIEMGVKRTDLPPPINSQ